MDSTLMWVKNVVSSEGQIAGVLKSVTIFVSKVDQPLCLPSNAECGDFPLPQGMLYKLKHAFLK